jgi:hypothetical protein
MTSVLYDTDTVYQKLKAAILGVALTWTLSIKKKKLDFAYWTQTFIDLTQKKSLLDFDCTRPVHVYV